MADELRRARATLGLSRATIATAAGVARSTVERVEAADPHVQLDTLTAVAAAIGIDLVLRAYPASRQPRDTRHMAIIEMLRSAASPVWRPGLEIRAGVHGEAADLVLAGPDEILHFEAVRKLTDVQAQLRPAQAKRDYLSERYSRPVRLVLAVEFTQGNRSAVAAHESLIRSQLPATSRMVMSALRNGRPLGMDGLVWIRPPPPGRMDR